MDDTRPRETAAEADHSKQRSRSQPEVSPAIVQSRIARVSKVGGKRSAQELEWLPVNVGREIC